MGRKSRLKERSKIPLLWRKPMAQVTYRGVQYDTDTRKQAANTVKVEETYRGIKFQKELVA